MNKQLFTAALLLSAALFGLTKAGKAEAKYKAYEHIKEFYTQVGEGSEEIFDNEVDLEEYVTSKMQPDEDQHSGMFFVAGIDKWEEWSYIFKFLMGEREKEITEFGAHVDALYAMLDSSSHQKFLQELWRNPKLSQEAFPLLVKRGVANQDLKALRIIFEAFKLKELPNAHQKKFCKQAILTGNKIFALEAIWLIADHEILKNLADFAYYVEKLAIAEQLMIRVNLGERSFGGGSHCLQKAVKQHDLSQVRAILDSDIEMNQGNLDALVTAIKLGFLDIVKEFIEYGADPNYVDGNHHSLIEVAVEKKQEEIAKYLLSLGLDFSKRRNNYGTAIDFAAENGMWSVVKLLQEQGCEYSEGTLIYKFIWDDRTEEIEELVASGFPIDRGSATESTPLMAACRCGKLKAAKSLIANGADVNFKANYDTPLSLAIRNSFPEVAEFLLKVGADPLQFSVYSYELFSSSCKEGSLEVVRLLVEGGLDVNHTWKNGSERHLLIAAKNNDKNLVEYLLENGATIPFGKKESYLKEAHTSSCETIVEMLRSTPEQGKAK